MALGQRQAKRLLNCIYSDLRKDLSVTIDVILREDHVPVGTVRLGGMESHKDCGWKIFAVRKISESFAGLNNGWQRLPVYWAHGRLQQMKLKSVTLKGNSNALRTRFVDRNPSVQTEQA